MNNIALRPVGEILTEAHTYLKTNWRSILKAYLFGYVMMLGIIALVSILVAVLMLAVKSAGITWRPDFLLIIAPFAIAALLASFVFCGKSLLLMFESVKNPLTNVRQAWKAISYKDGLRAMLLLYLILFAIYGSMVFLFIPAFIVSVYISFTMYIFQSRRIGGIRALILSRDYVKGYFWAVSGRTFISALPLIMSVIITVILAQKFPGWAIAIQLLYYFSLILTSAFMMKSMYLIYDNLVEIKGVLEPDFSRGRVMRWTLLTLLPFLLIVFATAVLIAINPAKQIQRAKDLQIQQEKEFQSNMFDESSASPVPDTVSVSASPSSTHSALVPDASLSCTYRGPVDIGDGVNVQVTDIKLEKGRVTLTAGFLNKTDAPKTISPFTLVMMTSDGSGAFPDPGIRTAQLSPSSSLNYSFSYQTLPGSPYIFSYNGSSAPIPLAVCK